ncbi:complement C1q tumor necrosis factor-related protein 2-like [Crassostrea virginica]
MFFILFALLMVMPCAFSGKVSTKPGLKMFRDEYKSFTQTCLDLGFAKNSCNSDKVVFHVTLSKNLYNLARLGRVVFEAVDLNEGKGYDPSTGIFTVPAPGVYVFDWTTLNQVGKYALTSLVVNGTYRSQVYCDGNVNTHLSCSKMTILKLKQGDQVWIGIFGGTHGNSYMVKNYTSFSGFKL